MSTRNQHSFSRSTVYSSWIVKASPIQTGINRFDGFCQLLMVEVQTRMCDTMQCILLLFIFPGTNLSKQKPRKSLHGGNRTGQLAPTTRPRGTAESGDDRGVMLNKTSAFKRQQRLTPSDRRTQRS